MACNCTVSEAMERVDRALAELRAPRQATVTVDPGAIIVAIRDVAKRTGKNPLED